MDKGLFPYPLTAKTVHLCLDMQRIFARGGPWATPWMERVLPVVASIGKTKFSGFAEPQLLSHLQARDADGLVITGSETDVCVLGTVLGAVDVGYRVVIVRDAICSSSDQGHDALMEVYHSRFSEQIETANADEILDAWS
jgi:nicotinamidase-related amidase